MKRRARRVGLVCCVLERGPTPRTTLVSSIPRALEVPKVCVVRYQQSARTSSGIVPDPTGEVDETPPIDDPALDFRCAIEDRISIFDAATVSLIFSSEMANQQATREVTEPACQLFPLSGPFLHFSFLPRHRNHVRSLPGLPCRVFWETLVRVYNTAVLG